MTATREEIIGLINEAEQLGDIDGANQLLDKLEAMESSNNAQRQQYLSKANQKDGQFQVGGPVMGNMEATAKGVASYAEPMLTIGSAAVTEPVAGLAGLVSSPFIGSGGATDVIDKTRERFTYQPRMKESQENLSALGNAVQPYIEPVAKGVQYLGDKTYELTGSPLAAALAKTAPVAALEILGLKGISGMSGGVRLLDNVGQPTTELKQILNKKGLTFEDLTPETRALIPPTADKNILLGNNKKQLSNDLQTKQLATGGREKSLAPYELVNGKMKPSKLFNDAVKRGWRESTVQMVKTSNRSDRKVMREMLNKRWRQLQTDSNSTKLQHMNVVGNSFNQRISFIKDKVTEARKELDRIAQTKLKGRGMDTTNVESKFLGMLDELDVTYDVNPNTGVPINPTTGKPGFNYKGSAIQKDKASQRAINDALELLTTDGPVDAYRFHLLKRQLDSLIDFRKKSKTGLSESGRKVLKGLRRQLNQDLRVKFDDYAEVNDVISNSLDVLDEFKRSTGVDVNFFDDASQAIGQEMRTLHTNYKKNPKVLQITERVDELANSLGGKFDNNYMDLAQFGNRLDEMFGASKSGSFQGLTEVGTAYATEGGPGAVRAGIRAAKDAYKDFKNSDMSPAYMAMDEILK